VPANAVTLQTPPFPQHAADRVSARLVDFVATARGDRLPPQVQSACTRALINAAGCILGGSRHPLVDTAQRALGEFSGPPVAALLGRGERADPLHAALINALAGAAWSFDDTYSDAMLHPSVPLVAALLALAERTPLSGPTFMAAFSAGLEAACRLTRALAVAPAQAQPGWSQTGVVSGCAVALAIGRALQLQHPVLHHALGIAASESAGTRITHGSMAASLIYARAAQSGLRAALLAAQGFTGGGAAIEGRFGLAELYADQAHLDALTDGLGQRHELLNITHKPFPCGLVIHPALDGVLRLRQSIGFAADEVAAIALEVSPAAMTFAWRPQPKDALEAKLSLPHWVAAAIVNGRAGLSEGSPDMVDDPAVMALRSRVQASADPQLGQDAARVAITLHNGHTHRIGIEHCTGSRQCPMSDTELDAKCIAQAAPVLGESKARELVRLCRDVGDLADVGIIARHAGASIPPISTTEQIHASGT